MKTNIRIGIITFLIPLLCLLPQINYAMSVPSSGSSAQEDIHSHAGGASGSDTISGLFIISLCAYGIIKAAPLLTDDNHDNDLIALIRMSLGAAFLLTSAALMGLGG